MDLGAVLIELVCLSVCTCIFVCGVTVGLVCVCVVLVSTGVYISYG